MSASQNKPQTSFWIISAIALVWNLMGVFFYLQQAYMTDEQIAALPPDVQPLYDNIPAWVTAAYAIAVFGGTLGCILLLMRKKLAGLVFIISFIGILVQMMYNFFMSPALEVYGPLALILPILVIAVGIFLIWYAKKMEGKGILS